MKNFWEDLAFKLRKANLDEHDNYLRNNAYGSRIFVPKKFNDQLTPIPTQHHDYVKNLIQNSGLTHAVSHATGGYVNDNGKGNLIVEPMLIHHGYGNTLKPHAGLRDASLPYVTENCKQDCSLGTLDGSAPDSSGIIKPFSMTSLRAHLPQHLDPANTGDEDYRALVGRFANRHGGFTHFNTPQEAQLEIHSAKVEDLYKTQEDIARFLRDKYRAKGRYSFHPTQAYLSFAPPSKTASLSLPPHILGPVRNVLHYYNQRLTL